MNATTQNHQTGGPLSPQELEFLRDIVCSIEEAIRRRWSLIQILEILSHDISGIVMTSRAHSQPVSLSVALKDGFFPKVQRGIVEQAEELVVEDRYFTEPGPAMQRADEQFLRDMMTFINFAIDNGLTLATVFDVLSHDIHGIIASCRKEQHVSVAAALKLGFSPKAAYFAGYSPDQVGEPENL